MTKGPLEVFDEVLAKVQAIRPRKTEVIACHPGSLQKMREMMEGEQDPSMIFGDTFFGMDLVPDLDVPRGRFELWENRAQYYDPRSRQMIRAMTGGKMTKEME